jgi:predicted O-methyltransferase YrrM
VSSRGLRRRLSTFVHDPAAALAHYRRQVSRALGIPDRRQRLQQARAARALDQLGVLAAIDAFVAARPPAAIPPDYADLLRLHRLVRAHGASNILEYGSGCSTLVLALAARDVADDWSVYSVDAEPYWADATRSALPPELAERCTVAHVPVVLDERDGVPGVRHAELPPVEPDFVYVDGPALPDDRPRAFDVLDLENRFKPGLVLVVDSRPFNAAFFREHLRRQYRVKREGPPLAYVFELVA